MNYIENTLLPNEKLVFLTQPHWIIFSQAVIALLFTLFLLFGSDFDIGVVSLLIALQIYQFSVLIIFVFTLILFIKAYITYQTSEYGITNKRVLLKRGLIQRVSLEIFLDRIEGIQVDQSIFGRILNYGTLIIIGTGGTRDPFSYVPDPLSFRKKVQEQISVFQR